MVRDELLRGRDAEPLRQHRAEGGHLHPPEAGERLDAAAELRAVRGLPPEPAGIAAVVVDDDGRKLLDTSCHRPREAVDSRFLAEGALQLARVCRCELLRVERAESLLYLQRSGERRLHRHLLVEREADQQRQRLAGQQPVGFVVAGEVESVGRGRRGGHGGATFSPIAAAGDHDVVPHRA